MIVHLVQFLPLLSALFVHYRELSQYHSAFHYKIGEKKLNLKFYLISIDFRNYFQYRLARLVCAICNGS